MAEGKGSGVVSAALAAWEAGEGEEEEAVAARG